MSWESFFSDEKPPRQKQAQVKPRMHNPFRCTVAYHRTGESAAESLKRFHDAQGRIDELERQEALERLRIRKEATP